MKLPSLLAAGLLSLASSSTANAETELPTMQTTNMGVTIEVLDAFVTTQNQVVADLRVTNDSGEPIKLAGNPTFTFAVTESGIQLPLVNRQSNPAINVGDGESIATRLSFKGTPETLSDEISIIFNANNGRDDAAPLVAFNNLKLR